jgi:phosphoenolpyruvate carboxylase
LETLICQVEIFGFSLAGLDIRQESSVHSDALTEIAEYLQVLHKPYKELSEAQRCLWLATELKTRRPLIPGNCLFPKKPARRSKLSASCELCSKSLARKYAKLTSSA